jgi:hypothetical protein
LPAVNLADSSLHAAAASAGALEIAAQNKNDRRAQPSELADRREFQL